MHPLEVQQRRPSRVAGSAVYVITIARISQARALVSYVPAGLDPQIAGERCG